MILRKLVNKIKNEKINENNLLDFVEDRKLLQFYEEKTIIDYILEYKRNSKEFDKLAIYDSEIARKYLDYDLKPTIDSEEILLSKYNS